MKITSRYTHLRDEQEAVGELYDKLPKSDPSFIICYYTEEYTVSGLAEALNDKFPDSVIHGCSSSFGVMTDEGYHPGPVVAILAVYDDSVFSAYGTSLESFPAKSPCNKTEIRQLAKQALEQAIENAQRVSELPELVILHSTIGHEELLVEEIEEQLGGCVKLIGGSAADNTLNGGWSIISGNKSSTSGVSVSVLYPSKQLLTAFSAGHVPCAYGGIVTKAKGRQLIEIDNKSAAEVYTKWIEEYSLLSANNVDSDDITALFPLGRIAGSIFGKPYYKLSHILELDFNKGLTLFSDIEEGQHVYLMAGGQEQLINRAAKVTLSAILSQPTDIHLHGGINIFCAGSMRVIKDEIEQVHCSTSKAYQGAPFICPFTYGEQGCFVNGENAHGNLMLSSAIFYSERAAL